MKEIMMRLMIVVCSIDVGLYGVYPGGSNKKSQGKLPQALLSLTRLSLLQFNDFPLKGYTSNHRTCPTLVGIITRGQTIFVVGFNVDDSIAT